MATDDSQYSRTYDGSSDGQTISERGGIFRRMGRRAERQDHVEESIATETATTVAQTIHHAVPTQRKPGSGPFGPDDPWDVLQRQDFVERLEVSISTGEPVALIAFGLDRFAELNRVAGLAAGDVAIRNAYRVLRWMLGPSNVAYFGSDCYAALLPYADDETVVGLVDAALERLARVDLSDDLSGVFATASAGIIVTDGRATTTDDALAEAEFALLTAKEQGGNSLVVEHVGASFAADAEAKSA